HTSALVPPRRSRLDDHPGPFVADGQRPLQTPCWCLPCVCLLRVLCRQRPLQTPCWCLPCVCLLRVLCSQRPRVAKATVRSAFAATKEWSRAVPIRRSHRHWIPGPGVCPSGHRRGDGGLELEPRRRRAEECLAGRNVPERHEAPAERVNGGGHGG